MIWKVVLSDRARRAVAERVIRALDRLAESGQGDVKRLRGSGESRLRMGDCRVRFSYKSETSSLYVLRVLHRGQVYRV